eukprot:gene3756-4278_t
MAKSKKKKQKNADFSKVKLKVGKKKPSAANSTDVSFKSRAISILGQLEEKNEPTNRRNLSLKDILSHLSHYNQNTRQDASLALKDFFIQHPTVLRQNLSQVIPKLLEKSVDSDHIVRKNFISCLRHVFSNITEQEIYPFFSFIMAHLNCAMTHINEDIQLDSFQFLDICLESFPKVFMKDSTKVLPSILSLISYKQNSRSTKFDKGTKQSHKGISSLVSQEISIDPTSKISSLKTKQAVLERLLKISSLIFKSNDACGLLGRNSENEIYLSQTISHVQLHKFPPQVDNATSMAIDRLGVEETVSIYKTDPKKIILSHLPALFQCWNEAKLANFSNNPLSNAAKDSSMPSMLTISEIIKLNIMDLSLSNSDTLTSLGDSFFDDFIKFFMKDFPYSSADLSDKYQKKASSTAVIGDTAVLLNINICCTYVKLLKSETGEKVRVHLLICRKVLRYIQSLLANAEANSFKSQIIATTDVFICLCEIFMGKKNDKTASQEGIMSNKDANVLQKKLIELVFLLPEISKDIVESFAIICHCEDIPQLTKHKVIFVLFYCLNEKKSLSLPLFLSFVFSVVLGMTVSQLERLQNSQSSEDANDGKKFSKYFLLPSDGESAASDKNAYDLISVIADILQTLDCNEFLLDLFKPSFERVLIKFVYLPATTALSLLLFFNNVCKWRSVFSDEYSELFQKLAELMLSITTSENKHTEIIYHILMSNDMIFGKYLSIMNSYNHQLVNYQQMLDYELMIVLKSMKHRVLSKLLLVELPSALMVCESEEDLIAREITRLKMQDKLKGKIDVALNDGKCSKLRKVISQPNTASL